MRNEKGSALLIVLLATFVFTILGLAILSSAVNSVKRTEIRKTEVATTAEGNIIMNEILANIKKEIQKPNTNPNLYTRINFATAKQPPSNYKDELDNILDGIRDRIVGFYGDSINKLEIDEISDDTYDTDYDIDSSKKSNYFTRIYEIVLEVKDPTAKPSIIKTYKQRFILSPTPSFLNFAVGSNEVVNINGSPDIVGNVYAGKSLKIVPFANFTYNDADFKTGQFVGPSIFGTAFIGGLDYDKTADLLDDEPFFKGIYDEVKEDYTGIPDLKPIGNDFLDINFRNSVIFKRYDLLTSDLKLTSTPIETDVDLETILKEDPVQTEINELIDIDSTVSGNLQTVISNCTTDATNLYLNAATQLGLLDESDIGMESTDLQNIVDSHKTSSLFSCNTGSLNNLYIIDDSYSTNNIFLGSLPTSINTLIYTDIKTSRVSATDPVAINEINDEKTFYMTPYLNLKNNNNVKLGWLMVDGNLEIDATNDNDIEIEGNIHVDKNFKINGGKKKITIKGNIIVNGDLEIYPDEENIEIQGTIIVGKNFKIKGIADDKDNIVAFDSTAYVNGESEIYNTNIQGFDIDDDGTGDKQLVLISNGKLDIARINDFKEATSIPSLIDKIDSQANLKAFFYTEADATLYGVGSLFEIDGGLFSKGSLTINAIRGNLLPSNINNNTNAPGLKSDSANSESRPTRFYVEYDKYVIINQLESLPRVNRLQVIPDNLEIR